jgi:hypothetical protein
MLASKFCQKEYVEKRIVLLANSARKKMWKKQYSLGCSANDFYPVRSPCTHIIHYIYTVWIVKTLCQIVNVRLWMYQNPLHAWGPGKSPLQQKRKEEANVDNNFWISVYLSKGVVSHTHKLHNRKLRKNK